MELRWRKASVSADTGACIEIAEGDGHIFLRESDEPDVVVQTTRRKLRAFLDGVQAGEFRRFRVAPCGQADAAWSVKSSWCERLCSNRAGVPGWGGVG